MANGNSKCNTVLVKFFEEYAGWLRTLHECSDHQSTSSCRTSDQATVKLLGLAEDVEKECGVPLYGPERAFEPR